MKLHINLTEDDVRLALLESIERKLQVNLPKGKFTITVETKSKQNYKAEWENANYRVAVEINTGE